MTAIEGEIMDEETQHLPAVREPATLTVTPQVPAAELVARLNTIREAMQTAMVADVDFGVIPGTDKPTLLKPGAEKLGALFQLDVQLDNEKIWHDDGHLTVISKATVWHQPTGARLGAGEGMCTTRESRYASRNANRKCPACGAEAIIKGKAEYGGGWVCFKKKNGCGAKYADDAAEIVAQQVGKVANPDLADSYNTVTKMASKRARVDAVLSVTGASALFTQDVEETTAASEPERAPVQAQPEQRPVDPHGYTESRADFTPPAGATENGAPDDPANVRVHFGKNANTRLGDLTQRSREWYAGDAWAEKKAESGRDVTEDDRRLRRAARLLSGLPAEESGGPFDDSVPFLWIDRHDAQLGVHFDPWRR